MKRAQAVVNSSLGVLSHYDSYFVREVMNYKSGLSEFGRFSGDGLRFYPDALSWRLWDIRRRGDMPPYSGRVPPTGL